MVIGKRYESSKEEREDDGDAQDENRARTLLASRDHVTFPRADSKLTWCVTGKRIPYTAKDSNLRPAD